MTFKRPEKCGSVFYVTGRGRKLVFKTTNYPKSRITNMMNALNILETKLKHLSIPNVFPGSKLCVLYKENVVGSATLPEQDG